MTDTPDRLAVLRQLAEAQEADVLLITHPPDLRWALGFSGSNGLLVVLPTEAVFITDGRYTEQARQEVTTVQTEIASSGLAAHLASSGIIADAKRAVVASDHLTLVTFQTMQAALGPLELVAVQELLVRAVASKSESEIEGIRRAQALTAQVFEAVLPVIRAGVTEREVASEIVYEHLKRGASAVSFEPIVAAGAHGALPHARPSDRVLAEGDLVVVDMGGVLDGLCSDMTRTVAIGEPGEDAREAYAVVREAQKSAIEGARAGMTGTELDQIARSVIANAGLGEAFSHSLGHGVGYDVHEWPRLSQHVEHVLPEGATVTIEPGVYIPGRFGVRIEDVIVLRSEGAEHLTTLTTELLVQ